MVTLSIGASTDFTTDVMDFVYEELEKHNFPADLRPDILTAVEEIFVNIASYEYRPTQKGSVKLSVTINEKAVICFEDSGQPFNPLKNADPDLDVPVMERKIGGLGIHFIKNIMDKAEYRYTDGKNILTITKDISKQDRDIKVK